MALAKSLRHLLLGLITDTHQKQLPHSKKYVCPFVFVKLFLVMVILDCILFIRLAISEPSSLNYASCACGGGALLFANASLNVPAAFSWYSRFAWSNLIACVGHTDT
jgi:hypothetical protein